MNVRWSFGVLALVFVVGCKINMDQDQDQEQGQNGTDGGTPTTSFVDSVRINLPPKVCVGTNYQLTATVYPLSSDQSGTWSGGNSNGSITSSGILSPTKIPSVPVTFRQTKTGKTVSRDVPVSDCGTPTTGGIITPVGTQTVVMGQSETYFGHTPSAPNDAVSNAKIVWSVSPGSCITAQAMGLASATNYSQVKVTAIFVGTGKLRAAVGNATDSVAFTCVSNTGTVGNAYISIDPVSWTTTVGGTKQFTATCHNFPAGTLCQPYFYSVGTGCVAVNGETKTLTNDPIFGTGTFQPGFAKARASNCNTQVYVQASKFNNQIYNYATVTVN